MRAAGLPVTVRVTGRPRDLPAVTDLSAFRIIQEALTNTLRHAGPATAAVTVDYGPAALRVEVTDTGRGLTGAAAEAAYAAFVTGGDGPGHGLRGMRERAAAAGGTIDVGPRSRWRLPRRGDACRSTPGPRAETPPGSDATTTPTREGGPMIRVLLADDQALIRAGFRVLLEAADDIVVIGEAVNGDRPLSWPRPSAPTSS